MHKEEATLEFSSEIRRRFLKGFLDVFILQLVQSKSTWGYDIIKRTESEFKIKLRHGALYPTLNRLESAGFLKSRTQLQKGHARKIYDITKKGELYLQSYNNFIKEQLPIAKSSRKEHNERKCNS